MAGLSRSTISNLNADASRGPFKITAPFQSGDHNTMGRPFRVGLPNVGEDNHGSWQGLIDAELGRAIVMGRQTASQFGFGVYDVDIMIRPDNTTPANQDTEHSVGTVQVEWFHPTVARCEALMDLKNLEVLDDTLDILGSDGAGGGESINDLLAIDLNVTESSDQEEEMRTTRGSQIIRFGWSNGTPRVARNSALTINLNPHSDSDVSDNYETQFYCLTGGSTADFAIMPRKEAAVNPYVDDGMRLVEETWAFPVQDLQVDQPSSLIQPVTMTTTGDGYTVARFRGIHALGGLIYVTLPDLQQSGSGVDLLDIQCSLSARRWVSL